MNYYVLSWSDIVIKIIQVLMAKLNQFVSSFPQKLQNMMRRESPVINPMQKFVFKLGVISHDEVIHDMKAFTSELCEVRNLAKISRTNILAESMSD